MPPSGIDAVENKARSGLYSLWKLALVTETLYMSKKVDGSSNCVKYSGGLNAKFLVAKVVKCIHGVHVPLA